MTYEALTYCTLVHISYNNICLLGCDAWEVAAMLQPFQPSFTGQTSIIIMNYIILF